MGLDMYLGVRNRGEHKFEEIGYWRKANSIHAWFERFNGGSFENCSTIIVPKEALIKLKNDCEYVLRNSYLEDGFIKNGETLINGKWEPNIQAGKIVKDSSYAEEIMPTKSGFFFGDLQYDEWYIDDLERTVCIVDKALQNVDFDKQEVCYSADW